MHGPTLFACLGPTLFACLRAALGASLTLGYFLAGPLALTNGEASLTEGRSAPTCVICRDVQRLTSL